VFETILSLSLSVKSTFGSRFLNSVTWMGLNPKKSAIFLAGAILSVDIFINRELLKDRDWQMCYLSYISGLILMFC
jgi:hypothetical protein